MTTRYPRLDTWARRTRLTPRVPAGMLIDTETGAPITEATLTVQVCADDDADPPTPLGSVLAMPWNSAANAWVGSVEYDTAYDSRETVRIVVRATAAGGSDTLMDAVTTLVRADGR